jgi:ferredoxin
MNDLTTQLRELARALFADGKVESIVGYEEGSLPLRTSPCVVRHADDVGRLVWDARCENNLAVYLRDVCREGNKVGIVAKGCDGRAIVGMLVEKQLDRENLHIIAIPCRGVIDRKKIENAIAGREILEAVVRDREIVLELDDTASSAPRHQVLPLEQFLCASCRTCLRPTAPLYDVLVGEPAPAIEPGDGFEDVGALEARPPGERWAHFAHEFARCIRCYACREACPLCYCTECLVDQTQPAWFGKTDDLSDTLIFHLMRALHLAGQCVDCGACSRACPMDIDLRALNRKMIKDAAEWYGYQAGLNLEAVPPLATFQADDPQEFIR